MRKRVTELEEHQSLSAVVLCSVCSAVVQREIKTDGSEQKVPQNILMFTGVTFGPENFVGEKEGDWHRGN